MEPDVRKKFAEIRAILRETDESDQRWVKRFEGTLRRAEVAVRTLDHLDECHAELEKSQRAFLDSLRKDTFNCRKRG